MSDQLFLGFIDTQYFNRENTWVIQVFLLVFGVLLIDFLQRRIVRRLAKRFAETPNLWDDTLIESVRRPLSLLIWVLGISLAARLVSSQTENALYEIIQPVRDVAIIAAITWFLVRFIKQAELNIIKFRQANGKQVDITTMDAIAKLLRLSIYITSVLVMMQTLGFSVSGVLAFGGVGGIAVGFAARDLLANFFGGLMIYMDRPFSVGDWIRSPDRNIEGTVEKIGWRLTEIRTFDKRPLYIPNATFANIAVENPSRMSHRRIYETIGLRFEDAEKMDSIVKAVESMLQQHPDIDNKQTLMVNFNGFGTSALEFFLYTFTRTTVWTEYHQIKQNILLQVMNIVSSHDAKIAYSTSTVHIPEAIELEQNGLEIQADST